MSGIPLGDTSRSSHSTTSLHACTIGQLPACLAGADTEPAQQRLWHTGMHVGICQQTCRVCYGRVSWRVELSHSTHSQLNMRTGTVIHVNAMQQYAQGSVKCQVDTDNCEELDATLDTCKLRNKQPQWQEQLQGRSSVGHSGLTCSTPGSLPQGQGRSALLHSSTCWP